MYFSFFCKWMLILGLLTGQVMALFAQDDNLVRAERVYGQFVTGQGDSIHAGLTKELQAKLAPVLFNDTYAQTEKQFGKLQSKGEWRKDVAQGVTIYYSDLTFERYSLRFLVAFDADGRTNTLRLLPVPAASTAKPVHCDKNKMEEREITVGADGFKLPGTLTLPKFPVFPGQQDVTAGKRKVPVVILVHGSGPQDRDETLGSNKPFRDLAWGLAERGIAVIRYDKRTKVYGAACVPAGRVLDYDVEAVDDAVAIAAYAKTLPEIASDSVYILGHSLGGTLAPRIAARADGLAGIIILAGLARPFEDAVVEQIEYISSLTDSSIQGKGQMAELRKQTANVKKLGTADFDDKIPLPLNLPASYWLCANHYNPVEVAAKLRLPILVLQGERDYQVTMEDFGRWRLGLLCCKNASFKSYPLLNHAMQEGSGKATPFEYNQASPVPAYVMEDIAAFIH